MDSIFGVESPAYVGVRAALSIVTVGLLGALSLRLIVMRRYVGPDAAALRRAVDAKLPTLVDAFGIAAVAATFARLAAQHAAVFGSEVAPSATTLSALLFRAGWGRAWWIALASAVAITWIAPRLRESAAAWAAASAAIITFALTQPLAGHPAAAVRPFVAVLTQLVHIIGAGAWIGGLAMLTAVAIPAARTVADPTDGDARIAGLVRAFSPTALVAAALLGLTGVIAARSNLGGVAELWRSDYGRILLLKLALLSAVAATGAYNWRRVLPSLGSPSSSAALRRSSLVELATATAVLIVTAVLVATPMPGE